MAERQNHSAAGKKRNSKLNDKLESRVAAYALAAGAAGVAVLALSPPAKADIIYTPANIPITFGYSSPPVPIDLNGDGTVDMSFAAHSFRGGRYGLWSLYASARPGNGVIVGPLGQGYRIGSGGKFAQRPLMAETFYVLSSGGGFFTHYGPWFTDGTLSGFLGLQFLINGDTHYGWVGFTAGFESGTVTGYAYETLAGESIGAGQTQEVTPEPGTLDLLALGSLGLGFWRRRKAVGSQQ